MKRSLKAHLGVTPSDIKIGSEKDSYSPSYTLNIVWSARMHISAAVTIINLVVAKTCTCVTLISCVLCHETEFIGPLRCNSQ